VGNGGNDVSTTGEAILRGLRETRPIDKPSDLASILSRAESGQPKSVKEAKAELDRVPNGWENLGNVSKQALLLLVDGACSSNPVRGEAIRRQADALKVELAGPNSSTLERLLADRVALCWVAVNVEEMRHTMALSKNSDFELCEFFQKRLDHAHRRYLQSIKALAQVRRLQLPNVQVNIADKQINVQQTG
jgi:hypothetical protein